MTTPSDFFSPHNDLSAQISKQNVILPMSNADLRGVEPEMKAKIVGFAADGEAIWRRVPIIRIREGNGFREIPMNTKEDRDDRASAR